MLPHASVAHGSDLPRSREGAEVAPPQIDLEISESARNTESVPEKDPGGGEASEEEEGDDSGGRSMDNAPRTAPKTSFWKQHVAAVAVNLGTMGAGAASGWSAAAVPVLRGDVADPQPLRLSIEQTSWVGALIPLGALVGALPTGPLAQRMGRKGALLTLAFPMVLGWLFVLFAGKRVWLLYLGRFFTGVSVGSNTVLVSLYCEEIAEVHVRGIIGSYMDMATSLGILYVYVLGALLTYFWYTVASLVPTLVFVIFFIPMPESPTFLAERRREDDARVALRWLRGSQADVEPELKTLLRPASKGVFYRTVGTAASMVRRRPWYHRCTLPRVDRPTLKALAIVLGLMFFAQASGSTAFVYYTEDVFRLAHSGLRSDVCMIVIGAVPVVGTTFSILLIDRAGRRLILLLSTLCMGLSLLGFSSFSRFNTMGYDLKDWHWVPLVCMIIYMFFISFGYGPIKYFMMAELIPSEAKGWGSSLCVGFSRVVSLVLAKEFPIMIDVLGQDITYGIFCLFCFLGTFFVMFCIPETKGKSREQIQRELGRTDEESAGKS